MQILHGGHGHWLFMTVRTVRVTHTQKFLCITVCSKQIRLRHMDVQMQSGGYDCGLFAVAFTTALVHGRFLFDRDKLSAVEELTPFPVRKEDKQQNAC